MDLKEEIYNLMRKKNLIPNIVDSNRKYWFIRTQGGSYFDEFFLDGFVAIGHEDVPCVPEEKRTDDLIDKIKINHPQATRILNQVYKFCKEIKKGDVVIIPSASSASFAFGYIEDDTFFEVNISNEDIDEDKCTFTRRRKINWIRGIPKSRVDPKLYTFFRNQQTLSCVDEYSEFIERALNPFYIKNDIAHLTLSVETSESPNAIDIPLYMQGLLIRANEIADELKLNQESKNIRSRINVQSAGIIELLGDPVFIGVLALLIIGLFGGKITFKQDKEKTEMEASTDGLIGAILKIWNKYSEKDFISVENMKKTQQRLEIKDPRETQKKE